jgi:hypothetical protein
MLPSWQANRRFKPTASGVREAEAEGGGLDSAIENLRILGYAVIDGCVTGPALRQLQKRFDELFTTYITDHGVERLQRLGEGDLLRCPLAYDTSLLQLALHPA